MKSFGKRYEDGRMVCKDIQKKIKEDQKEFRKKSSHKG